MLDWLHFYWLPRSRTTWPRWRRPRPYRPDQSFAPSTDHCPFYRGYSRSWPTTLTHRHWSKVRGHFRYARPLPGSMSMLCAWAPPIESARSQLDCALFWPSNQCFLALRILLFNQGVSNLITTRSTIDLKFDLQSSEWLRWLSLLQLEEPQTATFLPHFGLLLDTMHTFVHRWDRLFVFHWGDVASSYSFSNFLNIRIAWSWTSSAALLFVQYIWRHDLKVQGHPVSARFTRSV